MRRHLPTDTTLSKNRQLLLGAYFTQEYALESAALFNPSIVLASRAVESCRRLSALRVKSAGGR